MIVNKPGKKNTKFELILDEKFFTKEDIFITVNYEKVEIVSEPTVYYNKWYWKLLNFLTFGLCFNVRVSYICRIK